MNPLGSISRSAGFSDRLPGRLRVGRIPFLVLGAVALIAGTWGGLVRLAWIPDLPGFSPAPVHGVLLVLGFLATLISLERAVGLSRRWAYGAPVASGFGVLLLLAAPHLAPAAFVVSAMVLIAVNTLMWRLQPSPHVGTMFTGSVMLVAGAVLWAAAAPLAECVPFWSAFLVLTIAGERLELSRAVSSSRWVRASFLGPVLLVLAGPWLGLFAVDLAVRVEGAGQLLLAAWLFEFDVARRSVRSRDMFRFVGVTLLGGYLWLAVAGVIALVAGASAGGSIHDAMLHSLMVGFVMSMVFGHAPIVIRGILGAVHPYSRLHYLPVLLLQASLALRVSGDVAAAPSAARLGALLNAVALLAFLVNTVLTFTRRR